MNKVFWTLATVTVLAAGVASAENYTVSSEELNIADIANALVGAGVVVTPYAGVERIIGGGSTTQGIRKFSNFHAEVVDNAGELYKPFTDGIVLSTGRASGGCSTGGANTDTSSIAVDTPWPTYGVTDVDLANLFHENSSQYGDAAGAMFVVCPSNRTINIPLMVASEEYFLDSEEWAWPDLEEYQDFPDAFAFFVEKGAVSDSMDHVVFTNNISRLENGDNLSIATVNPFTNQVYFVANVYTNEDGEISLPCDVMPMEYNGAIIGPCAVFTNAVPGELYTIKIVVADGGNSPGIDTAVFLKSKGITSGADLKLTVTVDPTFLEEPAGKQATFTFKVENLGYAPAWGITLTNNVPVSSDGAWSTTEPMGWDIPDLAYRESYTTNLVVDFGDAIAYYDSLTVGGTVYTDTGDYDMSNNTDEAVILFNGVAMTNLVVTKVWEDGDDQDGLRDTALTICVTTNGVAFQNVDLTAVENWTKTLFVPVEDKNGEEIAYTVEEPEVPDGYTPVVSGSDYDWTITNTHTPATTNLVVTKVWNDGDDQDGLRGTTLTVTVTTNGVTYQTMDLTATENWTKTLENLPVNAAGTPIAYAVEESAAPAGYTPVVSGSDYDWTITNTHTPATTNLVVTKVWDDGNDQDGLRGTTLTVTVTTNGIAFQDVDLTATENWTKTLEGIPVYADGSQIAYEIL